MISVREFKSADDLLAHYKALKARQQGPEKPRAVIVPFRPAPTPVAAPVPAPIRKAVWETSKRTLYPWPIGPRPARDILWVCRTPSTQIMLEVCEKHGVRMLDIKSPRRTQNLVLPRQEIAYRLRMETMLSLPQIGKLLKRDHTTILHSVARFEQRLASGSVSL